MSRELLQIRVNEASKFSKMKISNFQCVVCESCSKLEINYLHNLKASMKYYAILPNEAPSELAAATNQHRFYTKDTFFSKHSWVLTGPKEKLSIICKNNVTKNTLIVKTEIWLKVEAFFKML